MNFSSLQMSHTMTLMLLACVMICIQASPLPQSKESQTKKPTVPGVGINTGFDEIVVESSLNVRNKNPEKRQSKPSPKRLVIPHMIPKKFGEGSNSKYTHTDDPLEKITTTVKPVKTNKKISTSTTSKTEKPETDEPTD